MTTLNALHQGLGEFLTAVSRVERLMVSILITCNFWEKDMEDVFSNFMGKMFGDQIKEFKRLLSPVMLSDHQRSTFDDICNQLDALRPMRNHLVHGDTVEIGMAEKPIEPFRIGTMRGDFDYLNKFVADPNAAHSYSIARIHEATEQCMKLQETLSALSNDLFDSLVRPRLKK